MKTKKIEKKIHEMSKKTISSPNLSYQLVFIHYKQLFFEVVSMFDTLKNPNKIFFTLKEQT